MAEAMGIGSSAVATHIERGMKRLRDRLEVPMPDLEDEIHRYAAGVEDLVPRVAVPLIAANRGRRPWLVAAAAVVVLLFTAALGVTRLGDDRRQVATSGNDDLDPAPVWKWRAIADGPLEPTTDALSVWTGEEMLVFGGFRTVEASNGNSDGFYGNVPIRTDVSTEAAAYDPASNTWRSLAAIPGSVVGGEVVGGDAVWNGAQALVATSTDVFAYDVDRDAWSKHPLPLPATGYSLWTPVVAWDGDRLLIWAYQHRRYDQPGFFVGFNPASGDFDDYDVGPLDYRWGSSGTFSHGVLTIVGGAGNTASTEAPSLVAAVFEPTTKTWSDLEPGPLADVSSPWLLDTGDELVVAGGWNPGPGTPNTPAAALSKNELTWRIVADAVPAGASVNGVAAWTGDEVVILDSPRAQIGEPPGPSSGALDPETGTWRPLPDVPGGPACGSTGVWTGHEFIVWGGSVGCTVITSSRQVGYRMTDS